MSSYPGYIAQQDELRRIRKRETAKIPRKEAAPVYKCPVRVEAVFEKHGEIVPVAIFWSGQRYTVDKIIRVEQPKPFEVGCGGYRYYCTINGRPRNLFVEFNGTIFMWFVVSNTPEPPDWAE